MYAYERFSFGIADLAGGFALIPVLVGAFGFSEVLTVMSERFARPKIMEFGSRDPAHHGRAALLAHDHPLRRDRRLDRHPAGRRRGHGGVVVLCRRASALSKEPEKFGKGSIEGLMAAETGDNASVPGGIIPALALAIPGSAPCAVLLAAMIIHGVQAGPMLMVENPQFVYDVVAMVLFSTLGILFFGLFFIRPLLKISQIPRDDHDADHLRAVRDRLLFARVAPVRRLHHARLRHADLHHAPVRLSGGAASCSASCWATSWTRTCGAGWC